MAELTGAVVLAEDAGPDTPCCVVLSSDSAGQLVIGHLFLRPADHLGGADPDVVRLLKDADLPLLRWPGATSSAPIIGRTGWGRWKDGLRSRTTPGAGSNRYVRDGRVHRFLPRRGMRADDLRQRRHRHA